MHWLVVTLGVLSILHGIVCPPVTKKVDEAPVEEQEEDGREDKLGLEYERYLKEVVSVLESDEDFRKKLEESNVTDIKSGEIARHLEFVSHGIRTKLDELKRKEIDRLRQAMKMHHQIERGMKQMGREMKMPKMDKERLLAHVDHQNPNTFEADDLAKLIKQATDDLENLDRRRRDEFKQYEMEKEMERRERMRHMDEKRQGEEQQRFDDMQRKHADHPKLHHPGGKEQLEQVWEESDGMAKEDFDPKTFFYMHDTNGDGLLDEVEIEALFQSELDKVYDRDNPEDDPVERYEEMNRMREHVFSEVDRNGDKAISLKEFMDSTNGEKFEKDEGWDTLDEKTQYTDEELEQFVKEYEERQRRQYEQQGHRPPVDPSAHQPIPDHLQGNGPPQGGAFNMDQGPPQGNMQFQQQQEIKQEAYQQVEEVNHQEELNRLQFDQQQVLQPVDPQQLDQQQQEQNQQQMNVNQQPIAAQQLPVVDAQQPDLQPLVQEQNQQQNP